MKNNKTFTYIPNGSDLTEVLGSSLSNDYNSFEVDYDFKKASLDLNNFFTTNDDYADSFVIHSSEGLIYGEDINPTNHTASQLVDFSWLQEEPKSLPLGHQQGQPPLDSLSVLEELWGRYRNTGVDIIPNTSDKFEKIENKDADKYFEKNIKKKAMNWAARMAHFGQTPEKIEASLAMSFPDRMESFQPLLAALKEEYGLIGKVYISAACFDDMNNPKTRKALDHYCSSAKYVISDNKDDGKLFGKTVVASVPWDQALQIYSKEFPIFGYKLASDITGDPKAILKASFLNGPRAEQKEVMRPSYHEPLRPNKEFKLIAKEVLDQERDQKEFKQKLEGLKKSAYLSEQEYSKLSSMILAKEDAHDLLSQVLRLNMTRMASGSLYNGSGLETHVHTGFNLIEQAERKSEAYRAMLASKADNTLNELVRTGQLLSKEADQIRSMGLDYFSLHREIAKLVLAAQANRRFEYPEVPVKEYEGAKFTAASQNTPDRPELSHYEKTISKLASNSGVNYTDIDKFVRWARQKMSEGYMGDSLDKAIVKNWHPNVIKASMPVLSKLRTQHEGLSGSLYIDSAAYAFDKNATACKTASELYKDTNAKAVLAMKKCSSCVHAYTLEDGSKTCSVYRKILIPSVPVDSLSEYREATIKKANTQQSYSVDNGIDINEFGMSVRGSVNFDYYEDGSNKDPFEISSFSGITFNYGDDNE